MKDELSTHFVLGALTGLIDTYDAALTATVLNNDLTQGRDAAYWRGAKVALKFVLAVMQKEAAE